MRAGDRKRIESALRAYFQEERTRAKTPEGLADATAALAMAAATEAAREPDADGFLRAAIRFTPRSFWAMPAFVVVLAAVLAFTGAPAFVAQALLVASGPVLVLACLAGVVRARSHLMQELEASCVHNAAAVACARLAILGGTTLLALALTCAACSAVVPAGAAAAYALAPYLVAAAGGLMLARKAPSSDATAAAVIWSAGVCVLCVLLRVAAPDIYAGAAIWIWAVVSAVGGLWCVCEIVGWVRLCAQGGLDLERRERVRAF